MRTVATIIAREYLQRVRTKTFIFSTLAVPVLILGLGALSGYLGTRSVDLERRLLVVDATGVLVPALEARLEAMGFRVTAAAPGELAPEELDRLLEEGQFTGALFLDEATLSRGRALWRGRDDPPALRGIALRQAVTQAALEVRLAEVDAEGVLAPLLEGITLQVERVGDDPDRRVEELAGMLVAFVGAFFLYFVLVVYGTMVLRAVQEEKTGRIVEIIISSVRPWQLMLGKILGVGAVGLTQLGIWLGAGAAVALLAAPFVVSTVAALELPVEVADFLPAPGLVSFFVVCFLAGYFIFASLFAAVGAVCSTEEEAQQLQVPVVLLVLVPFFMLMPVLEDPDGVLAVPASLFPWFSPVLMFARVAVGSPPWWQVALSVVLMLAALLVTAWVAGRIYRTGILMQGKRPTLPEIWRWVREG